MKINLIIFLTASTFFAVINNSQIATAQCTHQVSNLNGTATVNGINVTVTDTGLVAYTLYCGYEPYWIGSSGPSGNGSYTFSFFPAVSEATLNFSAISNISTGREEVYLIVNGMHYAIPSLGNLGICEPLPILTPNGNLRGCANCGGSGCDEINIPGPISTITVADSVISGSPNGTVFSIFICDSIQTSINNPIVDNNVFLFQNPFNNNLSASTTEKGLLEITVYDLLSNKLIQRSFLSSISLNTEQLAKGIYLYEVRNKNGVIKKGKVVKD